VERQSFLSLATQVDYAFCEKLKLENMFIVCFEFSFGKGLKEAIEQKQILVLRIIRHHNQETDYSVKNFIDLLICFSLHLGQLSNACLNQRIGLRNQVIR